MAGGTCALKLQWHEIETHTLDPSGAYDPVSEFDRKLSLNLNGSKGDKSWHQRKQLLLLGYSMLFMKPNQPNRMDWDLVALV